jgi:hypothetical protein
MNILTGDFVIYDKTTGVVAKYIRGVITEYDWDPATQGYIVMTPPVPSLYGKIVDLDTLTVVPKTEIPYTTPYTTSGTAVADSVTEFIVGDLPDGTSIDGEAIEDNELVFTFDTPGEYSYTLTNQLYSPTVLTIAVDSVGAFSLTDDTGDNLLFDDENNYLREETPHVITIFSLVDGDGDQLADDESSNLTTGE